MLIWNTYSDLLIPRNLTNESSRRSLLASLNGTQFKVPNSDLFGKSITRKHNRTIIVLPGCNSCSVSSDGGSKIPIIVPGAIYYTSDDADVDRLRKLTKGIDGFVVLDSRRNLVNALAYDIAPVQFELDDSSRIKGARSWP